MGLQAQLYPFHYVNRLRSLVVPGYTGYPGGVVAITRYVSANTLFGGANLASVLRQALATAGTAADRSTLAGEGVGRVFTGQGMPDDFVTVLSMVDRLAAPLAKNATLAPFFKQTDYLQAMLDASVLGQDCIGFVGTYLATAGIEAGYVGRRPLDYAAKFKPVGKLADVDVGSVLMLTNGMHIQIVDWIWERSERQLVIDICQASSMKDHDDSKGPQCNARVTLTAGGGDFLPIEKFRAAKDSKSDWAAYAAEEANPTDNGYEMYLRKKMTQHGTATGYLNGAIFQLSGGGTPGNPVAGSVYAGTLPGLTMAAALA
ncbi:hypothetical protein [Cypionkella psychrotolerans]|uniref:hypothetical protein n=1 Tax=Cypionkella psychrotolerans TaxID=1678131 RepID=UPI0006B4A720|nr:hypothetical protein [Cypionkella psychrotolerans]